MARIGFKPGTKTLSADSELVKGGVYAPTTLSTVDADLATGNIKNGITIFGKVGSADVFDISDATAEEAEVLDPETFYAVGGGIRTGTMPTVAITDVNDDYPAGYHAGNVGGLAAIDAHLTPANIALGVNIFGYVGTLAPAALAEDVEGDTTSGELCDDGTATYAHSVWATIASGETTLLTKNLTFDPNSIAFAVAFACLADNLADLEKLRLYMGGLLMQESAWIQAVDSLNFLLRDFKALSGSKDCVLKVNNTWTAVAELWFFGRTSTSECPATIAVGSVKLA